jgi:membrane-associated protein
MIKMNFAVFLNSILLFLDAESLIRFGGLLIVCLVVYASTGLFFCFFVPSGVVLFSAGVFVATGGLRHDIYTVCGLLIAASVLGNITGYWFGRQAGPSLYRRKDSRFFRRSYLIATEEFYKKYGGLALMTGFFLPIIRTFSPIVAGMIKVKFHRFILPTFAGSVFWILSFVAAGYFIGSQPLLKPLVKYIVIGFILVVTIPVIIRTIRELRKRGRETGDKV